MHKKITAIGDAAQNHLPDIADVTVVIAIPHQEGIPGADPGGLFTEPITIKIKQHTGFIGLESANTIAVQVNDNDRPRPRSLRGIETEILRIRRNGCGRDAADTNIAKVGNLVQRTPTQIAICGEPAVQIKHALCPVLHLLPGVIAPGCLIEFSHKRVSCFGRTRALKQGAIVLVRRIGKGQTEVSLYPLERGCIRVAQDPREQEIALTLDGARVGCVQQLDGAIFDNGGRITAIKFFATAGLVGLTVPTETPSATVNKELCRIDVVDFLHTCHAQQGFGNLDCGLRQIAGWALAAASATIS